MNHQGFVAQRFALFALALPLLMVPVGCGGPSSTSGSNTVNQGRATLLSVGFGRLVDIYAYQRIDPTRADRRDQLNRRPTLVAKDVVVRPGIETEPLFDAAGDEVPTANYEFLPFDVVTGHDELMIRWDNRGDEAEKFQVALAAAQAGLTEVSPAFRGQNTSQRPIPVVPRDAAIVLRFSRDVGLDPSFFDVNPSAVQLLEFNGDPHVISPADAFRSVPYRPIVHGDLIVLDTTILGGEASGGFLSAGMPESLDSTTANIRIAIPSRGTAAANFFVAGDPVAEFNDLDSFGRNSIIRDFRSGNRTDGSAGILRDLEPPMIVGDFAMGIIDVAPDGEITINKRHDLTGHPVYLHARFPFVGGTISPTTGLALGPSRVPTSRPLRAGDMLMQLVTVQMPDGSSEVVRIRAEILQNLDIGTVEDDPAFPFGPGLAADGSQGNSPIAHLRVGPIRGTDSLGRPVAFVGNGTALGTDCEVRRFYYEHNSFRLSNEFISDSANRYDFLKIDPRPTGAGTGVDPGSSVSLRFSEPMDAQRVDPTKNLVLTDNSITGTGTDFATKMQNPKNVSAGVVPVRWSDQSGDGTTLQLQPPKGFFHSQGSANDIYWFHLRLDATGITDLGGNRVELFNDNVAAPISNWSASLTIAPQALSNRVGWHTYPFESLDEDGTLFGSQDMFGQFRLVDGRLMAAQTVRFSKRADSEESGALGSISRINRGECLAGDPVRPVPHTGQLYQFPRMLDTVAPPNVPSVYPDFQIVSQPVGHVIEPHQPRGSRMMMRYLEDDLRLSYRLPSDFALDVEQLYWSPFGDSDILFDVFDRYTMALAHADKRPDLHFTRISPPAPGLPFCQLDCTSMNSSLSTNFADNVLHGTTATTVFEDKVYAMNPGNAFRDGPFKYLAYPKFDHTYTWRDSRLVSIDAAGNITGLGGARDPQPGSQVTNDWTADVDSPWVPSSPTGLLTTAQNIYVLDEGDFRGNRRRDHDPIALPLLADFKVFPDGPANNLALGTNGFQVALMGWVPNFLNFNPGGYYNAVGAGCAQPDAWPLLRVHSTGGLDPTTGNEILVDPANTNVADGGWIKDSGAIVLTGNGLAGNGPQAIVRAPAGDGMLHWMRADFVRKVSTVTFGFFDTLRPNLRATSATINAPGFPDFTSLPQGTSLRMSEFTSVMDPPLSLQPAGTSTVLEIRGAADFLNSGLVYNPTGSFTNPNFESVTNRGNLLNPNYACEAYRYSQPNSTISFDQPRLAGTGLTPYVTENRLSTIRDPQTNLLPRYINFRLVMTNNVDVTPAISPSLRSMSIVYRMQAPN